jgi:hypothetical protein
MAEDFYLSAAREGEATGRYFSVLFFGFRPWRMPTFLFLEVRPILTERSRSLLGFVLGFAFLHGQFRLGGCAA